VIGSDAQYVSLVASKLPGMTWEYYTEILPLAIGLQLRNAALYEDGARIIPPGRTAEAKAREILGDRFREWLEEDS
jgi:hypothetical protein